MATFLLSGPPLSWAVCPMCSGNGWVRIFATSPARTCPTCRGGGKAVTDQRFSDGYDWRAHELGLAPVIQSRTPPNASQVPGSVNKSTPTLSGEGEP